MPFNSYFNRDLSWLSFNYRVLQEAKDPNLPLYERIKFLAIYSSNLDEFFKVRVASAQSLLVVKKKKREKMGIKPEDLLENIYREVDRQQEEFGQIFRTQILPELEANNVFLLSEMPDIPEHKEYIETFFEEELKPFLHPELLVKDRIQHFLRDDALYLATEMYIRSNDTVEASGMKRLARYALIQIPVHYFSRFIQLPSVDGKHYLMFLDDILRCQLGKVFHGYHVKQAFSLKMSRSADLLIEDEFNGDLVEKINKSLVKRQIGLPARFLHDAGISKGMLKYLRQSFTLKKREIFPGGRYHNFKDFFGFPNPVGPQLEREATPPLPKPELDQYGSLFEAMDERNWMLHFPYHSYDYVIRFLNQAAVDPNVEKIQTTQYRVASNSAIVNALVRAATNGKDVSVFVELKARFDEASNLASAKEMEAAGVKITYSIPGLKVHAKVAMVQRREGDKLESYAFLSTGNFNEKTARIYADHGLFTKDAGITNELNEVFKFLRNRSHTPPPFERLLVAQFNMLGDYLAKIDREIEHAKAGRKAKIILKINNLEDSEMIDKLYEASRAGVEIQLIIRGICCLRPGVEGQSDHITITRLVDQFLEHARVAIFHNDGEDEMYLASADWMGRNLRRRIEVGFPVLDADLKAEVMHVLELQLADNVKAVRLNAQLNNVPVPADPDKPIRMQTDFYQEVLTHNRTFQQQTTASPTAS
ncbi:MAG: polyphosphate kinase 1 [Bacteroidota bacterium]